MAGLRTENPHALKAWGLSRAGLKLTTRKIALQATTSKFTELNGESRTGGQYTRRLIFVLIVLLISLEIKMSLVNLRVF